MVHHQKQTEKKPNIRIQSNGTLWKHGSVSKPSKCNSGNGQALSLKLRSHSDTECVQISTLLLHFYSSRLRSHGNTHSAVSAQLSHLIELS